MKLNKSFAVRIILLAAVISITALPLVLLRNAKFDGADSKASEIILENNMQYRPWNEPLWVPPSKEIETLIFSLQAAIGAGIVCYILGFLHGKYRKEKSSDEGSRIDFEKLKEEILGRRILVTNRHEWSNEEIIVAYSGQSKVEYVFKNLKNSYQLAIRPQYHWTDQKIESHILMCIIGYLLTIAAYTKTRMGRNM